MSWQAYIDSSLVGSGHIDRAAITSAAGDSTWAASEGFAPQPAELKVIADILTASESDKNDNTPIDNAYATGIWVAGVRHVLTRIDGRSAYVRVGRIGVCFCKTKQAIIIAHHNETQTAGNATQVTEALCDYLIKAGY